MSTARVYSWDKPEHGGASSSSQHPPATGAEPENLEGGGMGWESDDSSESEDVQDPQEATQHFLEYLL